MCRFISQSKHALIILSAVLLTVVQFRGIANAQPVLTDQELGAFAGVYRYDKESIRQHFSELLDSGEVDELNTAAQKWGRTKLRDFYEERYAIEFLVWPGSDKPDLSSIAFCLKIRSGVRENKEINWEYEAPAGCAPVFPIPANLDCLDDQICFMTKDEEKKEALWRFSPDLQSLTLGIRERSEIWRTYRLSRKSVPDYEQWLAQPDVLEAWGIFFDETPRDYAVGSGFSVNPNFVVTAAHVMYFGTRYCTKAFVFDSSGSRFNAEVFAASPFLDLAVLRVSEAMEYSAALSLKPFYDLNESFFGYGTVDSKSPKDGVRITRGKIVNKDSFLVHTNVPGVPGDSGSAFLDRSGNVAGILSGMGAGEARLGIKSTILEGFLTAHGVAFQKAQSIEFLTSQEMEKRINEIAKFVRCESWISISDEPESITRDK